MKLIASLFLFTSFCSQAQQNPKDIINTMIENVKKYESLTYTVDYSLKESNSTNTNHLSSLVHLYRDKTDTIWGGMIWMSEEAKKYNTYSFYDKDKIYTVMNPISKVWRERAMRGRLGLSVLYNNLIWTGFLKPQELDRKYGKAKNISLLSDTIINGNSCYHLQLTPYYGEVQNEETEMLYITKGDYFPVLVRNSTTINGGVQYSELAYSSYTFDKAGKEQFSAAQVPATYKVDSRDREMPKGIQAEPRIDRNNFPLPGNRRR